MKASYSCFLLFVGKSFSVIQRSPLIPWIKIFCFHHGSVICYFARLSGAVVPTEQLCGGILRLPHGVKCEFFSGEVVTVNGAVWNRRISSLISKPSSSLSADIFPEFLSCKLNLRLLFRASNVYDCWRHLLLLYEKIGLLGCEAARMLGCEAARITIIFHCYCFPHRSQIDQV